MENDRSTAFTGTNMARSKKAVWSDMLMTHRLKDVYNANDFNIRTAKHFTWQGKTGGNPIFSRIDRYYISPDIHALGGNIGTWPTIVGISDHTLIHY